MRQIEKYRNVGRSRDGGLLVAEIKYTTDAHTQKPKKHRNNLFTLEFYVKVDLEVL